MQHQIDTGRSWVRALHLFVLSSFAVAQPVFDLLGRNATYFIAHEATSLDIVMLVLLLLALPPLVVLGVEAILARVHPVLGKAAHLAAIGALLGMTITPFLVRGIGAAWPLAVLTFLLISALGAYAYWRFPRLRLVITWAAPAPLVFAGAFLLATPVRGLIAPTPGPIETTNVESDIPVVMVIFDELALSSLLDSNGELNRARFPGFARLSDVATWYPRATTVHPQSRIAVTSALTGLLPEPNAVPTLSQFPSNVFTTLAGSHEVWSREAVTQLCPAEICVVEASATPPESRLVAMTLDTAIAFLHVLAPEDAAQRWLPPIEDRWAGFVDAPTTVQAVFDRTMEVVAAREEDLWLDRFLESIRPSEKPGFYFLHSVLPHTPWRYLPSGQIYENDFFGGIFEDSSGGVWRDDEVFTNQGLQRFLLQTKYVDRFVGDLLTKLENVELINRALVIVMADHGISFEPGLSRRGFDPATNADGILPVPLFVKFPGQTSGEVDSRYAQTIDVVPTIVDVLGFNPESRLDGSSLADPPSAREPVRVSSEGVVKNETDLFDQAIQLARAQERVFGDGSELYDAYAMGPYRSLVGTTLEQSNISGSSDLTAEIVGIGRFSGVDPGAAAVPARVTGNLSGALTHDLALVLNGTIASVASPYQLPDEDAWTFSFFVPPSLMKEGCNEVSLYSISQQGDLLSPIDLANRTDC